MPRVKGRRKKSRSHREGGFLPEEEEKRIPKSFVVRRGGTTTAVRDLVGDLRFLASPWTAQKLKEGKGAKLKDFVSAAGVFGVTHLTMLSQSEGGVRLRIGLLPSGPTLTFKVERFSLMHDIRVSQRRPHARRDDYRQSPLVILNGFKSHKAAAALTRPVHHQTMPQDSNGGGAALQGDDGVAGGQKGQQQHHHYHQGGGGTTSSPVADGDETSIPAEILDRIGVAAEAKTVTPNRLLAEFLTKLYPPIDVTKVTATTCRRVVLYNFMTDTGAVELRHYAVRRKPRGVSKGVKKIISTTIQTGVGGAKKPVIDMSRSRDVADFVLSGGSGYPSDSEVEDAVEVAEEQSDAEEKGGGGGKEGGGDDDDVSSPAERKRLKRLRRQRLTTKGPLGLTTVVALGLVELGPRMTLQLMKIEANLCSGSVLFDRNASLRRSSPA